MEAGYDQFPNIAREGWDVGSRGDEEDGAGKSFDDSFTLLFFHLISHSRIPPLFF